MKTFIITVFVSFFRLADLCGQWEIVNTDAANAYYINPGDICFINHYKGFYIANYSHKGFGLLIFLTNDGGKTWNKVFGGTGIQSLGLKTCIFTNNLTGFVACSSGLYHSSDGGVSWNRDTLITGTFRDVFFVNENIGFTAADTSIYKTTTGGESWQSMFNCNTCKLSSIFFVNDSTGWAVGESGLILKLTDRGTSEKIASGTTLPLNKVFFADRNTGWIAGGYYNISEGLHPFLLKTVNGGESWFKIEDVNCMIRDLYFINDREGWAIGADSTGLGMIIETIDGGNIWSVQNDYLRRPLIASCFKDGYGWAIGNGLVLKKDFSVITGIKEKDEIYHYNPILQQNYPNPFRSTTTIKYQLPAISNIHLSIYSITGFKIKTLVKERQPAGLYEVEWNSEGMAPGIYFYELKAGQNKQTEKMIILK